LVISPAAVGETTTVNLTEAPAARPPTLHRRVFPLVAKAACKVFSTETKTALGERMLVTQTRLASFGPALVMENVFVRLLPARTGFGEAEAAARRSAIWLTGLRTV